MATFCPSCGASIPGQGAAAPQPVSGVDILMRDTRAQSYWVRRFIAFLIDAVIVVIVLIFIGLVVAVPLLVVSGTSIFAAVFAGLFSIVYGVVLVVYFMLAEANGGVTLGKRLMGLKVIVLGGRSPNLAESGIRNVSKIYWLLLLLDVIVGLAVSKNYTQKYSDKMVSTEVVEAVLPTAGTTLGAGS
jgi:uncharacterized membrane protein